jgi:hypothetical protein
MKDGRMIDAMYELRMAVESRDASCIAHRASEITRLASEMTSEALDLVSYAKCRQPDRTYRRCQQGWERVPGCGL